jgi:hypothetical protein
LNIQESLKREIISLLKLMNLDVEQIELESVEYPVDGDIVERLAIVVHACKRKV